MTVDELNEHVVAAAILHQHYKEVITMSLGMHHPKKKEKEIGQRLGLHFCHFAE